MIKKHQLKRHIKKLGLKGYSNTMELMIGLAEYFVFYNGERPHQSLGNLTPDEVYATASGGGTRIVDKFSRSENYWPGTRMRQRHAAARRTVNQLKLD